MSPGAVQARRRRNGTMATYAVVLAALSGLSASDAGAMTTPFKTPLMPSRGEATSEGRRAASRAVLPAFAGLVPGILGLGRTSPPAASCPGRRPLFPSSYSSLPFSPLGRSAAGGAQSAVMSGGKGGAEEERLRSEYEALLKGTGRDMGMKQLKPQKGMRPLPSQMKSPSPAPSSPQDTAAPKPATKEGPQTMADLLGPKPRPQAAPPSSSPRPPAGPAAPLVQPKYAAGRGSFDEVYLLGVSKGDTAPPADAWGGLVSSDGAPVSLGDFSGRLLLLVPEPASHTGAVTDSFTRILNDLRDVLGSKRGDVAVLGVSPEPRETHAKMRKREGYKFDLASDPDRRLIAALKLWNPSGGVVTDRQTFFIDPDMGKIVHVWRNVQVVGHAQQVMSQPLPPPHLRSLPSSSSPCLPPRP